MEQTPVARMLRMLDRIVSSGTVKLQFHGALGSKFHQDFVQLERSIKMVGPRVWAKAAKAQLKAAVDEMQAEQKRAETPREIFLPGFDIGAFPNHLNRSSFIAPIARGRREFHRQKVMVTRRDCVLEYTGEQLDEADGDLIMALIACARPYAIGTTVPLNRAELLRKLKRGAGKSQYEWLHRRIKALTEATLFLEAKKPDGSTRYAIGKTVSFRVITNFAYDDHNDTDLPPDLVRY